MTAAAAALACLACAIPAHAAEIDLGNPDAVLRFDNTVRYNLGYRMHGQDPKILANPNYDDGDRNFAKGAVVANRLDLLSELDLEFLVQQLVLANVGQVQPDEIFLVAFYSLLRQRSNPFVGTRTVWA